MIFILCSLKKLCCLLYSLWDGFGHDTLYNGSFFS